MRERIQHSMILVITTTLAIAYAITIFFVYTSVRQLAATDVRYEADYLASALNLSGESFMKELDSVEPGSRITLIDVDGSVIYDTEQGEFVLTNHGDRPEVHDALTKGIGQDVRRSDTMGRDMFYYAKRLDDGKVIRISKPVSTAFFMALRLLPVMLILGILMLAFAVWFARRQAKILVAPINGLDLDAPLENDVYEELSPLLHRIDENNRQKEALANMRKEFSANVSHELKTPLTSISGYAEIMRDGLVKPEDMPVFSERIYKEANRLVTLINDIMKLNRLDEKQVELEKEDVDLYALSQEIVKRLLHKARECDVEVSLKGEQVTVFGVRQVLDEMIYNVIENAIKYNKKGGRVDVWVGEDHSGKRVVVKDTGIGIPESEEERIFERFYRVDKSHSKETGGTGLGLSIVKHGAELHHAHVDVDSVEGEGTEMTIHFET